MIKEILKKYNAMPNNWYPDVNPGELYTNTEITDCYRQGCAEKEHELVVKWKPYIPRGWYGFDLGSPCPHLWYVIIDEFLEYFVQLQNEGKISQFEIHQIKLKYGRLRFYVSFECNDKELNIRINEEISELVDCLFDEKLIY